MSKEDYAKQFFKTRLCRFFVRGKCFKGNGCSHAHSRDELHQRPNLAKTSLCRHWSAAKFCEKGSECSYAHGLSELRMRSENSDMSDQTSFSECIDGTSTETNGPGRAEVSTPLVYPREFKKCPVLYKKPTVPSPQPQENLGRGFPWVEHPIVPHLNLSSTTIRTAAYQYPLVQMFPSIRVQEEDCSPHNWLYQD